MNQNDYVLTNLTMISRLGLLENAQRTRTAIDSLVSILKYMENANNHITTISKEFSMIKKMFFLFREKKGPGFNGILAEMEKDGSIYIPQGILIDFVNVAFEKDLNKSYYMLEVKVVCERDLEQVHIIVQDNGETQRNLKDESLERIYNNLIALYEQDAIKITVEIKKGIGTKVVISIRDLSSLEG